jgi:hypothetical protein
MISVPGKSTAMGRLEIEVESGRRDSGATHKAQTSMVNPQAPRYRRRQYSVVDGSHP